MNAPERRCGECQLCCRLLPMHKDAYPREQIVQTLEGMAAVGWIRPGEIERMRLEFDKPAGERCPHQRHKLGCSIYEERPFGCRFWNCRWLVNDDTPDLPRPDRAGYVIDVMPDFITAEGANVEVVQIWVDRKRPDAWRHDAALLAYLERRGEESKAALFRLNEREAIVRFPASMCSDGEPHEVRNKQTLPSTRNGAERFEGLARCRRIKLEI